MKLIFVYNANSGTVNGYKDVLHKIFSPKTYECSLCEITYGVFSEKKSWKKFRETSNIEMKFLHKNEFLKEYRSKWLPKYDFPIILSEEKEQLEIFMASEEIGGFKKVDDLIEAIQQKTENYRNLD